MRLSRKSIDYGQLVVLIFKQYDVVYTGRDQILKPWYVEYSYELDKEQEEVTWILAEYFLLVILTFRSVDYFEEKISANEIMEKVKAHYYIYRKDVRKFNGDELNSEGPLMKLLSQLGGSPQQLSDEDIASLSPHALETISYGCLIKLMDQWYDSFMQSYKEKLASATSSSLEDVENEDFTSSLGEALEANCEAFAQIATDYLCIGRSDLLESDIKNIDEISYKLARTMLRVVDTQFSRYKKIKW